MYEPPCYRKSLNEYANGGRRDMDVRVCGWTLDISQFSQVSRFFQRNRRKNSENKENSENFQNPIRTLESFPSFPEFPSFPSFLECLSPPYDAMEFVEFSGFKTCYL